MRMMSKERLRAADELTAFIANGGEAKELMKSWHPEDAILINDMAFASLFESGVYPIQQADADCLPFLMLCSPEFIQARKEMERHLIKAFDAYGGNDVI